MVIKKKEEPFVEQFEKKKKEEEFGSYPSCQCFVFFFFFGSVVYNCTFRLKYCASVPGQRKVY